MIRKAYSLLLLVGCLAAYPLVAQDPGRNATAAVVEPETDDEDEIELERMIDLEATLVGVEAVPRAERSIARFRVLDGEYSGAMFSFSYDHSRPVRLRTWDVHNESGFHRIGGARVGELPLGQWDYLLVPGSLRPVGRIRLTLLQQDLNEDEERRRWHFKQLVSISPARWNGYDPEQMGPEPQAVQSAR